MEPERQILYKLLWRTKAPEKMKITVWRLSNNWVPTIANLHHRRLSADAACYICGLEVETSIQTCRDCPCAAQIWDLSRAGVE